MSYKPEVFVQGAWSSNALVFATEAEAKAYALNLFQRWTLCDDYRAVPSDLEPNYTADEHGVATALPVPVVDAELAAADTEPPTAEPSEP